MSRLYLGPTNCFCCTKWPKLQLMQVLEKNSSAFVSSFVFVSLLFFHVPSCESELSPPLGDDNIWSSRISLLEPIAHITIFGVTHRNWNQIIDTVCSQCSSSLLERLPSRTVQPELWFVYQHPRFDLFLHVNTFPPHNFLFFIGSFSVIIRATFDKYFWISSVLHFNFSLPNGFQSISPFQTNALLHCLPCRSWQPLPYSWAKNLPNIPDLWKNKTSVCIDLNHKPDGFAIHTLILFSF